MRTSLLCKRTSYPGHGAERRIEPFLHHTLGLALGNCHGCTGPFMVLLHTYLGGWLWSKSSVDGYACSGAGTPGGVLGRYIIGEGTVRYLCQSDPLLFQTLVFLTISVRQER